MPGDRNFSLDDAANAAEQPTEARNQANEIIVESLLLRGAAEIIAQSDGHDRSRSLRVAMMKEERACRKAKNWRSNQTGLIRCMTVVECNTA